MTRSDHLGNVRECGGDVAAFALGALEPAEAEAFKRHLESCIVCRDELASFAQVVDALAMSAPQHRAPKTLRWTVLTNINDTPPRPARPRHRLRPAAVIAARRPVLALAVVLVAIATAIAAVSVGLGGHGSQLTHLYDAQVSGSTGSAQLQVTGGQAELLVRHLQPPPAGEIYEVWLVRGKRTPHPTGALFSVTANGDANVGVPGDLRGADRVMVTPEPDGGSQAPTHPAVITAQLT